MLKKLIITPYFGDFPPWMEHFEPPKGYSWLLDCNLEKFKKRVSDKLGVGYTGEWGQPKVWDYRPTLGLLYEEELQGFDYWATMDLDVVFGDVDKWFPDEEIAKLDVWSNHDTYVAGFWSLYKNSAEVNNLFKQYPGWQSKLVPPEPNGWVENEYSRLLEGSGLKYKYSMFQGDPYHPPFRLIKSEGKLYQQQPDWTWEEIAMLHFRRDKKWPL